MTTIAWRPGTTTSNKDPKASGMVPWGAGSPAIPWNIGPLPGIGPIVSYAPGASPAIGSAGPASGAAFGSASGAEMGPSSGAAGAPLGGGGGGGGQKPKGMELEFLARLFGLASGNLMNGPPQFGYSPNMQAAGFEFNPQSFFGGLQGASPAQAQLDLAAFLSGAPNVQAAQMGAPDRLGRFGPIDAAAVAFNGGLNPNADYLRRLTEAVNPFIRIREGLQNVQAMPVLPPDVQKELDAIVNSGRGEVETSFQKSRQDLLNDMYGRGLQRSTIANDAGGQLLYGRSQIENQLLAQAAERSLGVRRDIRDFSMANLMNQGAIASQEAQTILQDAMLRSGRDVSSMQANLQAAMATAANRQQSNVMGAQIRNQRDLFGAEQSFNANQLNAQLAQQAGLANAGFQQERGMFGANADLQLAMQNAGFAQEAGMLNTQLGYGAAGQAMQAALQAGLANAGFQQEANSMNTQLGFQGALANYQGNSQYQQFLMSMLQNMFDRAAGRAQSNKQINLGYAGLQNELEKARIQGEYQLRAAQMAKPGFFQSLLGSILGGAGSILGGIAAF